MINKNKLLCFVRIGFSFPILILISFIVLLSSIVQAKKPQKEEFKVTSLGKEDSNMHLTTIEIGHGKSKNVDGITVTLNEIVEKRLLELGPGWALRIEIEFTKGNNAKKRTFYLTQTEKPSYVWEGFKFKVIKTKDFGTKRVRVFIEVSDAALEKVDELAPVYDD